MGFCLCPRSWESAVTRTKLMLLWYRANTHMTPRYTRDTRQTAGLKGVFQSETPTEAVQSANLPELRSAFYPTRTGKRLVVVFGDHQRVWHQASLTRARANKQQASVCVVELLEGSPQPYRRLDSLLLVRARVPSAMPLVVALVGVVLLVVVAVPYRNHGRFRHGGPYRRRSRHQPHPMLPSHRSSRQTRTAEEQECATAPGSA